MIPHFQVNGNLPPGIHLASFEEVYARYGTNGYRKQLLGGMYEAFHALKIAGCDVVYLDGSFVTTKKYPNDYDCCYNPMNIQFELLDRLFWDRTRGWRERQKFRFRGEFYPSSTIEGGSSKSFLLFFQTDRDTGEPKGIVKITLGDFP